MLDIPIGLSAIISHSTGLEPPHLYAHRYELIEEPAQPVSYRWGFFCRLPRFLLNFQRIEFTRPNTFKLLFGKN